jgi:hypothetical protein
LVHTRAVNARIQSEIRRNGAIFQQNLLLNYVSYVPWEQKNMILNLEESVFFLQFGLVLHPIPMY